MHHRVKAMGYETGQTKQRWANSLAHARIWSTSMYGCVRAGSVPCAALKLSPERSVRRVITFDDASKRHSLPTVGAGASGLDRRLDAVMIARTDRTIRSRNLFHLERRTHEDIDVSTSVPVFVRMLTNLSAVLDRAAAHAEAKKIDPTVSVNARLYPDMLPLAKQVQIASDNAKGAAARLAGQEPPKYEDTETTFADLKARIQKTISFLSAFKPEQIDGSDEKTVTLQLRGNAVQFTGLAYLMNHATPNFYFHVTTAYDILRHNGVDLGKADYLGTR